MADDTFISQSNTQDLINADNRQSPYSVGPVPIHTHNNIDTPFLPVENIQGYFAQTNTTPTTPPGRFSRSLMFNTASNIMSYWDLTNKVWKSIFSAISVPQLYSPSAAGTSTLDLSQGNIHSITMPAGNITIAFSNTTAGQCFIINIKQDGGGSRTVTWPTILWINGTTPTLTTTASKTDTLGIQVVTAGSVYYGYIVGQNI